MIGIGRFGGGFSGRFAGRFGRMMRGAAAVPVASGLVHPITTDNGAYYLTSDDGAFYLTWS
jgi:hypothetical protein